MNRYDLSLWDVGKRSLYVEKRNASKLSVLSGLRWFSSSLFRRTLRESLAPFAVKSPEAFDAKNSKDFREARKESALRNCITSISSRTSRFRLSRLHLNQDGIKRGGVAQVGKFF
jgi:hypothetical protein